MTEGRIGRNRKKEKIAEFLQEKERQTVEYSGLVCTDIARGRMKNPGNRIRVSYLPRVFYYSYILILVFSLQKLDLPDYHPTYNSNPYLHQHKYPHEHRFVSGKQEYHLTLLQFV